ncbi:efflux RND transporter periplasmic adaptor subunit [endosymbiont of Lamellibrachia barhami]|uniref:efflux RND transporter periplasmic adaptor subunit n=1 Tax=endosymbiont of Lamellibrachia barhami TaxID=205975 RepID=UPI0015B22F5B|nr:efflux RND transporter periplasmic adaptor subunit [endosymbiont of Lamellibrachia barhami]
MNPLFLFAPWLLLTLSTLVSAAPAEDSLPPKSTPVTMVKAIQTTMISTTMVRGEIESPSTPHIAAKVSAEAVSIKVDEGMHVESGQLLAKLDDETFRISEEIASAEIQRLQILIDNQQRILKRNKELFEKKLASQSVLDDALTALKQSQAELISASAKLKEARYQLSHTRVTSPVEGVIQQRTVSKGDYVKPGTLLFQIVSTDSLRARLYFPEPLAASIHLGMKVELTQGRKTVSGEVNRIRPMLEDSNRALHALVDFKNEGNWKPGSSIVARVILDEHKQAVAVPEKTLVRRPVGVVIYRIKDDTVTEQVVTTGLKQGDLIEVTSGLSAGDSIVLDGAAWLTDGARVEIQETGQ